MEMMPKKGYGRDLICYNLNNDKCKKQRAGHGAADTSGICTGKISRYMTVRHRTIPLLHSG